MDEKRFIEVIIDVNLRWYSWLERSLTVAWIISKLVGISTPTSDRCEAVMVIQSLLKYLVFQAQIVLTKLKLRDLQLVMIKVYLRSSGKEAARRKYK